MSEFRTENQSPDNIADGEVCADAIRHGAEKRWPVWRCVLSLLVVLVICALPRLWLVNHTEVISRDGTLYVKMAREWDSCPVNVVHDYEYHVGYPAAISFVHQAMSALGMSDDPANWDLIGQYISFGSAMAALAAVWLLAGLAFNWRVAWISALVFGLGHKFSAVGADVLSDSLSVALQMWAVTLTVIAVRCLKRKQKRAVVLAGLVGLLSGAGYLVRPEALLPGVMAILLCIGIQFRRRIGWRMALGSAAAAGLATFICAFPYMYLIGGITRKKIIYKMIVAPVMDFFCATIGLASASGLNKFASQLTEAMHPATAGLVGVFLATWIGWKVLRIKLPTQLRFVPRGVPLSLMLMATGGLTLLLVGMHSYVGYISHRHLLFLGALLSPLAGAGGVVIAEWMKVLAKRLGAPRRLGDAVFLLGTAVLASCMILHTLQPLHENNSYNRQAGVYAAQIAGKDGSVLTYSAWVAHYARASNPELSVSRPPTEKLNRRMLRWHIKKKAATILVISRETCDSRGGRLSAFLSTRGFVKVKQFVQAGKENPNVTSVYRIRRDALPGAGASRTRPRAE